MSTQTLRHCTITKNSVFADSMLPGSQAHGGGLFVSADAVLDHTIVAGNRATADISSGDDIQGPVSALQPDSRRRAPQLPTMAAI